MAVAPPQALKHGHTPSAPARLPPHTSSTHLSQLNTRLPSPRAKVLTKTADATTLTPDNFDIVTLTRADGVVKYAQLTEAESQKLLDIAKAESAAADA